MVKYRKGTPKFLQDKLDYKKWALIRQEYPKWLTKKRGKHGRDPEFSKVLVHDFVAHLGTVDRDFKKVNPATMLKSQDKGTLAIYDYVRKHLGQHDEKLVVTPSAKSEPRTPAKAKTSPPKIDDAKPS